MRLLFTSFLLLLSPLAFSQSFQDFLNYVSNIGDPGDQQTTVDSFFTALPEAPLLEFDTLAHFLYKGTSASVEVAGDFNGWDPSEGPLAKVGATDMWYRSMVFEPNARLDYKFVLDGGSWILDPRNPNTCSGGFGPNSELAMPQYVQPWEIVLQPSVPHGTVEVFTFSSAQLNGNYQVQVYMPPSYAEHPDRYYPSIYVQDGQEYLSLGSGKNILDNLIDRDTISEIVGIFIRPNNRNEEYAGSKRNQYRAFIVEEMVPYIADHYRVLDSPDTRAAIGTSLGANISAQISFYHPDIIGKAGLHSPAFWPNNNETTDLLLGGGLKPIQWASVWGTYEGSVFQNMQIVQAGLEGLGYEFYGNYYPEGHSWGLWRATFDELLIELFPPGLVAVWDLPAWETASPKVWPNPAAPGQVLSVDGKPGITAQLFNAQGQWVSSGSFPFSIPESLQPGIYFLQVNGGNDLIPPARICIFPNK